MLYHDNDDDNCFPVPDDVFTSDAGAQTSYDTYNPGVIDLTSDNDSSAVQEIEDNSILDLRQGSDSLAGECESAIVCTCSRYP